MGIGRQKEREELKAVTTLTKEEPTPEKLEEQQFIKDKLNESILSNEIEKEEIERLVIPEKKKREDKKEHINLGLVGDTIEARDFRAICKKNGVQINVALTQILTDWNMAHYNL